MIESDTIRWWYRYMENQRAGRLTLSFGGVLSPGGACLATTGAKRRLNPPDERKEGVADVCYILWFNSDWNIHLRPCWIVLYDFQGKTKIAAITANNDGCWENSYLNIRGKPLLWLSFSMFNITRGCIYFKINIGANDNLLRPWNKN